MLNFGKVTKGLLRQFRYYAWGIFRGDPHPYPHSEERKFNPLQKLSYIAVMYIFMPVVIITGWGLMFPDAVVIGKIFGTSGLHLADLLHIISGFVLSMFMFIHVYLCTIAQPPGGGVQSGRIARSRSRMRSSAALSKFQFFR